MKEKEWIRDQEIYFNNAKGQNCIPFKVYRVRRLVHLYCVSSARKKKKSSAFSYSGHSLKYRIKYKNKIHGTFTSARFEISI